MRTTDAVERLDPLGRGVEHEVGAGRGRVGTHQRDGGLLGPVAGQAGLADLHAGVVDPRLAVHREGVDGQDPHDVHAISIHPGADGIPGRSRSDAVVGSNRRVTCGHVGRTGGAQGPDGAPKGCVPTVPPVTTTPSRPHPGVVAPWVPSLPSCSWPPARSGGGGGAAVPPRAPPPRAPRAPSSSPPRSARSSRPSPRRAPWSPRTRRRRRSPRPAR